MHSKMKLVIPGSSRPHLALLPKLAAAIAGSLLLAAANAGTVVTNNIISQTAQTQTNIPVTFGQIFKDGDVPSGETVEATLDGTSIPVQVDSKRSNPDGSLRHAVLSFVVPTLAAWDSEPLTLSAGTSAYTGTPVSLTRLLATGYDATASLVIGGVTYTADAKSLLAAANAANACHPWGTMCNTWLSGPIVSEWIVSGPVINSSGAAYPNLEVYFHVRAYAGSPISQVRTNVVVENDWAYSPQNIVNYSATLTSGTDTYTDGPITHYPYTRWHKILWWGTEPAVYVRQDTQYIESTGAVSVYPLLSPNNLDLVRQTCAPEQHCDQSLKMGDTGAQPAIGPLPAWASEYLVDPDSRAYNYMLANDDAVGAYSVHYRDQATGWPLSIANHPYVTTIAWAYANEAAGPDPTTYGRDLLPQCAGCGVGFYSTGNPNTYDNEHQPDVVIVAYMVTGSFYYEQELDYINTEDELAANALYRSYSQGLVYNAQEVTRGKAWTIRDLADSNYMVPDTDPLKPQFDAQIADNITDLTNNTINNPSAQPLHGISNFGYQGGRAMAPWQDAFYTWAMGHMVEQGVPGAQALLNWSAQYQIGLMTSWESNNTEGFCWPDASAYTMVMKDSSGNYYTTWEEVYQATEPTLYGTVCNSAAWVTAMTQLMGTPWQASEMLGYPSSPTGYPANLQIGLTGTYASTDTNAQLAWQLYTSRVDGPTNAAWADQPQFDTLPRALPPTPEISLYASPSDVAAVGDSTTLYWDADNAANCSASWTSKTGAAGSQLVTVTGSGTFNIACTGTNGSASTSVTVDIGPQSPPPTITIIPSQSLPENTSSQAIPFTLTGTLPMSINAGSSVVATFPDSGIAISSGCGTSTLNCTVQLTPAANQTGAAVIQIRVTDQEERGAESDFTATATGTQTPVADNGVLVTTTDTPASGQVLVTNPSYLPLSYTEVSNPAHGTLSFNPAAGSFTYTPDVGFNGTDQFTFNATAGHAVSNTATEQLIVEQGSSTPTAVAGSLTVPENTAVSGTALVINPANLGLTYQMTVKPQHGQITLNAATGSFTYTPATGYLGADDFMFDATAGSVASNTAEESITVVEASTPPPPPSQGSPPTASPGAISTTENTAINGTLNASGSGTLSYAIGAQPNHGSVTVTASSGAFTYTPASGFTGTDTFTFTASNSAGTSSAAIETITVTAATSGSGGGKSGGGGALGLIMLSLLGILAIWKTGRRSATFWVMSPHFVFALLVVLAGIGFTAQAAEIVTNNVVSQTAQTQTNVPMTFGQVFKDGDVPAGETVAATLNGQAVQLQVDAKATNPDGSLRHAVLTALIPSLSGNVTEPMALSTASPSTAGAPATLAQLLATSYDTIASLNIGGTVYTADAKALLQAANTANACKPWNTQCNVWLSGPLVSEWIVGGPVKPASGTANPNIEVYFDVRAYAGATPGSIAYIRTDIVVENSWAYIPQTQPQYTATLVSGSASYTSPALTQYAYTRWHQVLWWNGAEPQVYVQQDTQYIQATEAVSRYEVLQPDNTFLNSVRQSCAPLQHCDQTQTMGNTGAQPAIGPLPQWTSTYILDPDIRAYNWMLANTDALGAYSIHFRDQATGWPLSVAKHPYVTEVDWNYASGVAHGSSSKAAAYLADLLPNCTNDSVVTGCSTSWFSTGNPNQWDNAHQPAEGYVAYMVTGSYYYMEEVAFGASQNEVWSNEAYRGYSQGLIGPAHGQIRGKAWTLREMADAAYILPDGNPLKAEFSNDVTNSLNDFNTAYTNNPNASPLGVTQQGAIYSTNGGTSNAIAPWQHNFLTWSAGHAAELGFDGAADFHTWLAHFEIGLMTDWVAKPTTGFCWLEASAYNVVALDSAGHFLPSYTAMYAATFPSLVGLACNSPTMVTAMGKLLGQTWQAGEMSGYPYSPTGFPANFQIGVASAADSALPNAGKAWSIFQSRSVQPMPPNYGYNNDPNFAVLPRSAPSTPIISLYASPNPVSSGATTTLYWSASAATSCSATWSSSTATSGQATTSSITAAASFPITCTGANGTTQASVSVAIASSAPPPTTAPPATSAPPPASASPPTGTKPPATSTSSSKTGGGGLGWPALLFLAAFAGLRSVELRKHL